MTMADLRDLLNTTRKYAVPIGEYLDRIGLTRRDGDVRRLGQVRGRQAERPLPAVLPRRPARMLESIVREIVADSTCGSRSMGMSRVETQNR